MDVGERFDLRWKLAKIRMKYHLGEGLDELGDNENFEMPTDMAGFRRCFKEIRDDKIWLRNKETTLQNDGGLYYEINFVKRQLNWLGHGVEHKYRVTFPTPVSRRIFATTFGPEPYTGPGIPGGKIDEPY